MARARGLSWVGVERDGAIGTGMEMLNVDHAKRPDIDKTWMVARGAACRMEGCLGRL